MILRDKIKYVERDYLYKFDDNNYKRGKVVDVLANQSSTVTNYSLIIGLIAGL